MADNPSMDTVTRLLSQAGEGNQEVWGRIYGLLYQDLHKIARSQVLNQRKGGLSPTSLISETWLRLARSQIAAANRSHLVSLIVRAMRYVLVDETRRALREKRGGQVQVLSLDEAQEPGLDPRLEQLLALDSALQSLAHLDERLAKVVEMRYFGGLEMQEIATLLGVTERTVRRDWRKARAFLFTQLEAHKDGLSLEDADDDTA